MEVVYGYCETVTELDALMSIAVRMTNQDLLEQLEDETSDSISDEWDRYMSEKVSSPQMFKKEIDQKYQAEVCVCVMDHSVKKKGIRSEYLKCLDEDFFLRRSE